MAGRAKKQDKPEDKPEKVAFKGFVDYRMSDDVRPAFEVWRDDQAPAKLWEDIHEKLASNYKVTFSFDSYHDAMQVSLTCNDPKHPDAGYCLTARSDTIEEALYTLFFKDQVLLEGQWLENSKSQKDKSRWG
jgi:hypothetical protein